MNTPYMLQGPPPQTMLQRFGCLALILLTLLFWLAVFYAGRVYERKQIKPVEARTIAIEKPGIGIHP